MDIPCAPILVDITVNGRTIKAVAQPTKQAFLYVFDRETGEPIWPIEERPVPQGRRARREVLADAAVPDQAAGLRPAGRWPIDDLIDFTPELRAEAVKAIAQYKIGPIFTPPSVSKAEGPIATLHDGRVRARRRTGPAARTIPRRTSSTCSRRAQSRRWVSCRRLRAPLRHAVSPGHGPSPARGRPGGSGSAGADAGGAVHRLDRAGPAARQAAVRPHHRDRSRQRRHPLAGRRTARRRTTSRIIRRSRG